MSLFSNNKNKVTNKSEGSYGSNIIIMSSNPEELQKVISTLSNEYETVLETFLMENNDYATVLKRRSN